MHSESNKVKMRANDEGLAARRPSQEWRVQTLILGLCDLGVSALGFKVLQ